VSWYDSAWKGFKEIHHATTPLVQAVAPAFGPYGMALAAGVSVSDKLLNPGANDRPMVTAKVMQTTSTYGTTDRYTGSSVATAQGALAASVSLSPELQTLIQSLKQLPRK
jgi:hypothetical protein